MDQVIDLLCARGCRAVTACIDLLEQGVEETAWAHLDASERARLLEELRAIMAVYGGRCRVDS
ncbi:MAG: hypothetical protein D6721_08575 [Gammaproteobacteria bacterium]|nr:MAG: hypothetical protein D6721_08575 [Gammaproteobacteria bacterium]